jgi:colanic acid biosynthesis glycosyl transferase WcaI
MPKTILILSPFFYPEPISTGKYNSVLAQVLADTGAHVQVVCSHPLYPQWVPSPTDEAMPGVSTIHGGAGVRYPAKPVLRRAVLELWYTWHVLVQFIKLRKQVDVVVPVFPPSLFMLVVRLLKKRETRVVGIVHDLQGVYVTNPSGLFGRALKSAITWVESAAFKACDHLVFLSATMRDIACKAYGISSSTTSVHYPFVSVDSTPQPGNALATCFMPGLQSIVYAGALGEKQAPDELVRMLIALLDANPGWQARVFSQGPVFDALKTQYHHQRLAFYALVPSQAVPELMARSDVQVIPQAPGTSDGSLPSKLPNIIAAGIKLLCITDPNSELAGIVHAYSKGAVSFSWGHAECLQAFQQLQNSKDNNDNSASHLLKQFTVDGLVERIKAESNLE